MPRRCTICSHNEIEKIDQLLAASGESFRSLASEFGVSDSALRRHKANHLPKSIMKAKEAAEIASAENLVEQIQNLHVKAMEILGRAERVGDLRTALAAIAQARDCLVFLLKLTGEPDDKSRNGLFISSDWIVIRETLITALASHPSARGVVAKALVRLEKK